MEPLDEQRGEPGERRTRRRRGDRRNRGGDRGEPHARLDLLAPGAAAELARLDVDRGPEDRPRADAPPALSLDHGSRERRQRGRPRRRRDRATALKPNAVLDPLAEPPDPTVQRREVKRSEARSRPPEPLGRRDVAPRRGPDHRRGVRLSRYEVRREDPRTAPARLADGERNLEPPLETRRLVAEEDRAPRHPRPCETQALRPAARTRRRRQPVRHRAAALTKVGEERTML
jgi:hypothetical protein